MRARNRDGVFQPHQLSEHFCSADQRDAALERGLYFRIAALYCSRRHHHRCIAQIFSGMADHHFDAAAA